MGKEKNIRIKQILDKISTPPDTDSLNWPDGKSLLAWILLETIYICRVVSLLQIIKYVFRIISKRTSKTKNEKVSKDIKAKRINVPPIIPEMYFIVWLVAEVAIYIYAPRQQCCFQVMCGYYLFESVVWVLYYAIFRRFYEEKYKIQHPLEYFVSFIIIIITQSLSICYLYKVNFSGSLVSGFLGNPIGDDVKPIVGIIGAVYAAVIISMIIGGFPNESSKKKRNHHIILGNGDVVQNRLRPRLVERHCNFQIYDLNRDKDVEPIEPGKLGSDAKSYSTVWIETPSFVHLYYLLILLRSDAGMIVVEKPITSQRNELSVVKGLIESDDRKRIFFLSYYVLEKALPLIYLKRNYMRIYEKYIYIKKGSTTFFLENENDKKYEEHERKWQNIKRELFEKVHELGRIVSLDVVLNEGDDKRDWANNYNIYGGQLFETFIHNVLIATYFVGSPGTWKEPKLISDNNYTKFKLSAFGQQGEKINLCMKKGCRDKCRYAEIKCKHGTIFADFDKETAGVKLKKTDENSVEETPINDYIVGIRDEYRKQYAVQFDLVNECVQRGLSPSGIDGLQNQIETIEWLHMMKTKIKQE